MRLFLVSAAMALTSVATFPAAGQRSELFRIHNQQGRDGLPEQRDWRSFKDFDYDRPEPGERRYFANRYYRDYRYYTPIYLGETDRIYREGAQYYCRRPDGTTGKIAVGNKAGLLNNALRPGESRALAELRNADGSAAFSKPPVCN